MYTTKDYYCTTSIKIKTTCIVQCITCYTVSTKYIEFLLRYFLVLKKIKFTGYIINNVSDDIIGDKRQEACSYLILFDL